MNGWTVSLVSLYFAKYTVGEDIEDKTIYIYITYCRSGQKRWTHEHRRVVWGRENSDINQEKPAHCAPTTR